MIYYCNLPKFQELIIYVADTQAAKRIFLRIVGYQDLYKRKRCPDSELIGEIVEEAAKQRAQQPFSNE